jgi:hypothetical protein
MKRACILFMIASIAAAGCGRQGAYSVEGSEKETVIAEHILCTVEESSVGDSLQTDEIVCCIGAQILESAYRRYRGAGYSDAVFDRMPNNAFTHNLNRLYDDLHEVLE